MKNNIRRLLSITIIITTVIAGCCMLKPVPRPNGCENSVIYEQVNNPAMVGTLIQLANAKALSKNTYRTEEAIKAVVTIKALLEKEPITFSDFLEGVKPISKNFLNQYGTELLLIDTALSGLNIDIPINECDKGLIISLCDKILKQLSIREGPLITE